MEVTVDKFFEKVKVIKRISTLTKVLGVVNTGELVNSISSHEPLGFMACSSTWNILKDLKEKSKGKLHIASQTDGDDDTICYDNEARFVNRQVYYVCRGSKKEMWASEKIERDE